MLVRKTFNGSGSDTIANSDGIVWCALVKVSTGNCRITGDGVDVSLNSASQLGIIETSPENPLVIEYNGDVTIIADFDEFQP